MKEDTRKLQEGICRRYTAEFLPPTPGTKLGISRTVKEGLRPLNGLRHRVEGDTCGWYIWAGEEFSDAPDFFVPLHVDHVAEWCPEVIPFLGLAPGWRFLLADGYEDAWQDPSLL